MSELSLSRYNIGLLAGAIGALTSLFLSVQLIHISEFTRMDIAVFSWTIGAATALYGPVFALRIWETLSSQEDSP